MMRKYAYVTWEALSKVKLKLIYFCGSAYTHAQMDVSDAPKLKREAH